MSYDVYLNDPVTEQVIKLEAPHEMRGGTYAMGGTNEAWLNITYNYGKHYYRVLGEDGIRAIYGKTGAQATVMLENAIAQLGDDVDADYWKATEGNAKRALMQLLAFARLRPDGVFSGD